MTTEPLDEKGLEAAWSAYCKSHNTPDKHYREDMDAAIRAWEAHKASAECDLCDIAGRCTYACEAMPPSAVPEEVREAVEWLRREWAHMPSHRAHRYADLLEQQARTIEVYKDAFDKQAQEIERLKDIIWGSGLCATPSRLEELAKANVARHNLDYDLVSTSESFQTEGNEE